MDGACTLSLYSQTFSVNAFSSTTVPFVDRDGRVFFILGGTPKDTVGWAAVTEGAYAATDKLRKSINFAKGEYEHRRGSFPTVRCGVSHGGGQLVRFSY